MLPAGVDVVEEVERAEPALVPREVEHRGVLEHGPLLGEQRRELVGEQERTADERGDDGLGVRLLERVAVRRQPRPSLPQAMTISGSLWNQRPCSAQRAAAWRACALMPFHPVQSSSSGWPYARPSTGTARS